jgi:large subunit ribosomal protein L24
MIKKGVQVEVITGKDKGKKGEVLEILRSKLRAKVKGINIIKKHEKTTKEKKGGIISKEDFIHMSNIKALNQNKEANNKKEEKNKTKGKA